jgi:hypothetical protein
MSLEYVKTGDVREVLIRKGLSQLGKILSEF